MISIHAPRGGSDPGKAVSDRVTTQFQSTLPVGGATHGIDGNNITQIFQSTLPVGGATDTSVAVPVISAISIHAPRGGSDIIGQAGIFPRGNFNPRSPWGERHDCVIIGLFNAEFQSTLPVGGATGRGRGNPSPAADFNPRSPWGERLGGGWCRPARYFISIHAPRGGSDGLEPDSVQ